MRFTALATDYDGTIADKGVLRPETEWALRAVKRSGRALILVSGRTHDCFDEEGPSPKAFDSVGLFDCVVSENGSVLYFPKSNHTICLAPTVPADVARALGSLPVQPMWIGKVMISSLTIHEDAIARTLDAHGVHYQREYNRDWVMFTPKGVTKALGLRSALQRLGLAPRSTVGIGDSFNDLSFLRICGTSFAVGDADTIVKQTVDHVLGAPGPSGTRQMLSDLVDNDLSVWGSPRREIA